MARNFVVCPGLTCLCSVWSEDLSVEDVERVCLACCGKIIVQVAYTVVGSEAADDSGWRSPSTHNAHHLVGFYLSLGRKASGISAEVLQLPRNVKRFLASDDAGDAGE